jgi:AraC family transcriptional regulator
MSSLGAAPDSLRFASREYSQGLRMGRHSHGEWRFCLALKGSYTDSWRGGYRTRLPGQLSLHPADEVHTTRFHSDSFCFHISLTGEWQERLLGDAGIPPEPHEFLGGPVPYIASRLYREHQDMDVCSRLVLEGLTYELIGRSAREVRKAQGCPEWVATVREYLHDRFREVVTLQEIAEASGIHPVHMARSFRSRTGMSIGEYVRKLRVEFAAARIADGLPLVDVAAEAGFADQSHLTRVFKKVTGQTPAQYRGTVPIPGPPR